MRRYLSVRWGLVLGLLLLCCLPVWGEVPQHRSSVQAASVPLVAKARSAGSWQSYTNGD